MSQLTTETLRIAASDGVTLAVHRSGSGPPLYALHGGPQNDHGSFGDYLAPLAAHRELYLPDQRGCGESDDGPRETYSLQRLAQDIEETCVALGHQKIDILGHSFGGPLALTYASRWGDRVGSLILVCAPVRGWRGVLSAPGVWPLWARFLREGMRKRPDWVELTLKHELGEASKEEELRAHMNRPRRYDPLRSSPLIRSASRPVDPRFVLATGLPVLGIYGKQDRRFLESARYLRSIGVTVHIIDPSGHMPFAEQPDEFHRIVREFLTFSESLDSR